MVVKVREREFNQITDALIDFSKQFFGEGLENKYGYLLCGQYLLPVKGGGITRDFLENLLRPRRWPRAYVWLPFMANSIRVKNNLRVLGCGKDQKLTIKIALVGLSRAGCLRREIKARRLLAGALRPSFGVPDIKRYDRKNGGWITEDMIVPTKGGRPAAEEFIYDHAVEFYRSTCRHHRVFSRKFCGFNVSELLRYLPDSGRGFASDYWMTAQWPVAFCHGDLSPDNMIRNTQGRLFVVDWEAACVMPVAADLRKIYTRHSDIRKDVLAMLASLSKDQKDIVQPEIQMALGLAADIAMREKNQEKMIQYYRQAREMSAKRSRQFFDAEIEKNQNLIKELCEGVK